MLEVFKYNDRYIIGTRHYTEGKMIVDIIKKELSEEEYNDYLNKCQKASNNLWSNI